MADREGGRVIVVGGGISGLATAFWLHDAGVDVTVLEASDRVGGVIRTLRSDGYLAELGPNSTLDSSPLLSDFFAKVGIGQELLYARPEAKARYVLRAGRLRALPMSPPALFKSDLFTWRAKLRVLREPFVSRCPDAERETVSQFVRRRLGDEFLDYVINPFVSGVYAGDPDQLSIRDAFFKVFALERDYGSLIKGAIKKRKEGKKGQAQNKMSAELFSFRHGMASLPDAIQRRLADRIVTQAAVRRISRTVAGLEVVYESNGRAKTLTAEAVVLATPAESAARLIEAFSAAGAAGLRAIPYAPVAVVFQGYRRQACRHPLDGFGFLVPAVEKRDLLGTIWNSSLFEGRAPEGRIALTSFVGGMRRPEQMQLSDEEIGQVVSNELRDLLGISEPPVFQIVHRLPRAIPQYTLGHGERIAQLESLESELPGLFVTGNFRGGISVGDCIVQAHQVAQRVLQAVERQPQGAAAPAPL